MQRDSVLAQDQVGLINFSNNNSNIVANNTSSVVSQDNKHLTLSETY